MWEASVSSPSGSRILTAIVGVLAFIGVSSSISPWLDALYSEIAIWVLGGLAVAWAIRAAVKFPDFATRREVLESWEQNKGEARELAEKHAAHPEVARKLAAQMLAEKQQRLNAAGHVPPPLARG